MASLTNLDFSETITACYLKIGRYRQPIDLILCEYGRLGSFLDLGPRSFTYEETYNLISFGDSIPFILICSNDNPRLALTCFTARSNFEI